MDSQDKILERILADPWFARPAIRWSFTLTFVLVSLFLLKPLIVNRFLVRADAYASSDLYNNAARECKKAIFFDGSNVTAWNTLGSACKSRGDLDNAVATYLTALTFDPANRTANFRVAMVFALQQNYSRAVHHFEQVRCLGPESPAALASDSFSYYRASLEMLSLCYERTNQQDKMHGVIEELAKTHPNNVKTTDKLQITNQVSKARMNL